MSLFSIAGGYSRSFRMAKAYQRPLHFGANTPQEEPGLTPEDRARVDAAKFDIRETYAELLDDVGDTLGPEVYEGVFQKHEIGPDLASVVYQELSNPDDGALDGPPADSP